MSDLVGTCIYCGQTMLVEATGQEDKKDLDRLATEKCTCDDAKNQQEKVQIVKKTEKNIENLFRDNFPEIEAIMKKLLPYIQDKTVKKVVLNIDSSIKAEIGVNSKGKIKVSLTEKNTLERIG